MDFNDYYNLLMKSTSKSGGSRDFMTVADKNAYDYKNKGYKAYDSYRDENGNIHIGDNAYTDNEDSTFTDSSGRKMTKDELDNKIKSYNTEQEQLKKKEEGKNAFQHVGDFLGGAANTVKEGVEGTVGFVGDTGRSIVNLFETDAALKKDKEYNEKRDAYLKQFLGDEDKYLAAKDEYDKKHSSERGNTSEKFKEQKQIAESFDKNAVKAYKLGQYIPGVSLGVEGVGTLASMATGDDGDINKRLIKLTQGKDWDKLSDEEKKNAIQQRNLGGALSTLDVLPAAGKIAGSGIKAGVKTGAKEGLKAGVKAGAKQAGETYGKSVLNTSVKDLAGVGVKEFGKQTAKSAAAGTVVGTGFGLGMEALTGGNDWGNAAMQGAQGGLIGGVLGSPMDISTGKAATKKAAKDLEVELAAAKKAKDAERVAELSKEMEARQLEETRIRQDGRNARQELQDLQDGKYSDDLFDYTTQDGKNVSAEDVQRATQKQLDALTSRRDEIASQVDSISDPVARESAMNAVNQLDDQIASISSGDSNALMQVTGGSVSKTLNTDRLRERHAGLSKMVSDADALDARTNAGRSVGDADAELNDIANGGVPDDARVPVSEITTAADIMKHKGFDADTKDAALEIMQDANRVTEVLDNLMTEPKYQEALDALDVDYGNRMARIEQMPPQRQEVEIQKLEDEYGQKLAELDQQKADAAPDVEHFTNLLGFLKSKEDSLITYANLYAKENPGAVYDIDTKTMQTKIQELQQEKNIAEITEHSSDINKPLIGSVENGIRPSESANPVVKNAVENVETANSIPKLGASTHNPGLLDMWLGRKRDVLNKFGEAGQFVSKVLTEAVDSVAMRNQKVALQTRDWSKAAGGKKGMEQVARALDGDFDAYSSLNDAQKTVHAEVKDFFKNYADELGLPENARITDYLPHIMNDKPMSEIDEALAQLQSRKTLDGKPLTAEKQRELEKSLGNLDYETLGFIQKNSLYEVKNGFLQKRKGAENYSYDLGDIITTYANAAHNTIIMKPAYSMVKTASESLLPKQNEYVAKVIHSIGGRPTDELGAGLNDSLERLFKTPNLYDKASLKARKLVYDATLGLNPGSALRNLQQGANTYAKLGEKYYAHGVASAIQALKHSNGMYDELMSAGVLQNRYSDFVRQGELGGKAEDALWKMFTSTEQFNRSAAYFGGKQRYLDKAIKESKGAFTAENVPDDVMRKAIRAGREMSRKTQFEFSALDTSVKMDGTTMKNLVQLQSYNIEQVRFLKSMIAGDTDSMFVKGDDGKYKMTATGTLNVARLVGANALFINTVGTLLGMDVTDVIPFYDSGEAVVNTVTGKEDNRDSIMPQAPLVQLLLGSKSKPGLINAASDPAAFAGNAFGLLFPGGTQIKKSIEGFNSTQSGEVNNSSGNLRFEQNTDFSNQLRGTLFGQYNTDAGKQWVKDGFQTYSESQTKKLKSLDDEESKAQYADFYDMSKSLGKRSARDEIDKVYKERGTNAAFRYAEEYNQKVDAAVKEYRKTHTGALPLELSKQINSLKINYGKLTLDDE